MGGNMSRINTNNNDGRKIIPSAYNPKPSNTNTLFPSCAPYPTNYNYKTTSNINDNNSNNNNNFPGYKAYKPSKAVAATTTAASTGGVISFHSAAGWNEYFEASKHSNKLVVIYFTATWCGPCKLMEPTIKELASKYNDIEIVKIDVDELFNVSRGFGVQAMPTFMFMKRGKQIDKVVGANKEDLQRKIEKHLLFSLTMHG